MIRRIIQASIDNRLVLLVLLTLVAFWGFHSIRQTPVDAIPDLSENQVILMTEWPGQAPQIMEDQVTYPLSTAMAGVAGVKVVRAVSDFGFSLVYLIFEDDVDLYWARSRVLEKLSWAQSLLPEGVTPRLGPDGTGVGHILWYVLTSDRHDLAELRSYQDFNLRYQVQSVPGVAEVASIGGFVQQYQVEIDPYSLQAYGIPLEAVMNAIRDSNLDVGGRLIEMTDVEYFVRGSGYIRSVREIEQIVVRVSPQGIPVTVGDLAQVQLGPDLRRGLLDENGQGEVVGGIVVMRSGENAHEVIRQVRQRLAELEPSLPEGMTLHIAYDRSGLIERSIDTLTNTLLQEGLVVTGVVLLFLTHIPSALIILLTLPLAVAIAFIFMHQMGITSNIMSLGGIAIAIGELVDAAIVMVENAHRQLAEAQQRGEIRAQRYPFRRQLLRWLRMLAWLALMGGALLGLWHANHAPRSWPYYAALALLVLGGLWALAALIRWNRWSPDEIKRRQIISSAARQVGPAIFFSMLIIITSFAPVFLLTGQEGKLFHPLAWTKTFAMIGASLLSITLVPVLMTFALRGHLRLESENPLARFFIWLYRPFLLLSLRFRKTTLAVILLSGLAALPLLTGLSVDLDRDGQPEISIDPIGSEFMPALDEGSLLYMPVTLPNVSINEAKRLLQLANTIIAEVPEVAYVLGKVGRADTATDPAPVSMIETIIQLHPQDRWRPGMTRADLISDLDRRLQIPGLQNGWTQPIINRINMLATGVRTDIGLKFFGQDLGVLESLALQAEEILRTIPGAADVVAERTTQGRYIDIDIDREAITRYGLSIGQVQSVIQTAIGGMGLTRTVEGRHRYEVLLRYQRDFRDSPEDLENILVTSPSGWQVPLGQLAHIQIAQGPSTIKSEDGMLVSTVLLNVRGRDMGSFIQEAQRTLEAHLQLPQGTTYRFSGQWENQLRAQQRLTVLVPVTIALVFLFLFLTFRRVQETLVVMLAVPFSLVGGIYLLVLMDVNFSVAVWVGFIGLFGVSVETGVVMVVYLQEALDRRIKAGPIDREVILEACVEGSLLRLLPKLMTVGTTVIGLSPILWATGTGSDVMRPLAIPIIGGMFTSTIVVLLVTPVLFALIKIRALGRARIATSGSPTTGSSINQQIGS
ncbi:MAG: efflux RND transporter permease subunit [Bradymonadales bacterium]|nr:efflux RND transporter permease subunit [Bradymonadales bacterium]